MSVTELQTISFDEEANTESVHVAFLISGESLVPQVVTNEFGVHPTRSWAKGDLYHGKELDPSTRQVREVMRKRPRGIWECSSKGVVSSRRVEEHLCYVLDILEPKQALIDHYLKSPDDYIVKFSLYWKPKFDFGSYEVESVTLARVANMGQVIEFCFST
jgi:hypothetical protein